MSRTRLSRVVFMGMGEPLANYDRVVDRCSPSDRGGAGGSRAVAAAYHGFHGGAGPGDAASRGVRDSR